MLVCIHSAVAIVMKVSDVGRSIVARINEHYAGTLMLCNRCSIVLRVIVCDSVCSVSSHCSLLLRSSLLISFKHLSLHVICPRRCLYALCDDSCQQMPHTQLFCLCSVDVTAISTFRMENVYVIVCILHTFLCRVLLDTEMGSTDTSFYYILCLHLKYHIF